MKFVVGYPLYLASPEMCAHIVAGLKNIDPGLAEVVFLLDGNDPDQRTAIERTEPALRSSGLKWQIRHADTEIRDMACHNYFIEYMLSTNAEAVIVPQDDIYFTGATLLSDLGRLLDAYGDLVGMVGLRHGCDANNSNLICARFDVDTHHTYAADKVRALPVGEYAERLLMTPGPLVYPRTTVHRIGKLDAAYRDWWWWSDYCVRAHLAGLKNVVLAIDALHFKCGQTKHSHVVIDSTKYEAADRKVFNDRYYQVFGSEII